MANIVAEKNGRRRIQFVAVDGKRKTVRLGKVSGRDAEVIRGHLESILSAKSIGGSLTPKTTHWLNELSDQAYARLAAVGLVAPRGTSHLTIAAFIDAYLASRHDLKPRSKVNMVQARTWLVAFFGEGRELQSIRPADAEDWRAYMAREGLGDNTARRHVGRARQFFKAAIRRELFRGPNPFDGINASVRAVKSRQKFIDRATADKVLEECPDVQWRLIFSLSRFGGLRCPSEHLSLKWSDINWEQNRIVVTSPKTEHHAGKGSRVIPLFPDLRQPLLDAFEEAEPGSEFVITRYRSKTQNLRTEFQRIVRRAGVQPWPKLFHNLRASRQTELAEQYPIHVVCAWIGNNVAIAQEHYLQTTDAHFDRAAGGDSKKAAQNPAQSFAESKRTVRTRVDTKPVLSRRNEDQTHLQAGEADMDYPRQGQKNTEVSLVNHNDPGRRGAKSGALPDDPQLKRLIAAWPRLKASIRSKVLRLVEGGAA